MKVRAKVTGDIQHPQDNGSIWGVRFVKGEILTIPDQYFRPELFEHLEPAPAPKAKRA